MVALRKLVYMHPSREHEQFHLLRLRESVVWFNQHHVVSEEPRTIFRHTREISQALLFFYEHVVIHRSEYHTSCARLHAIRIHILHIHLLYY